MKEENTLENSVQAVETAFRILEQIRDSGELSITEVANKMDFAKSTSFRYLKTLEHEKYLVCEENKYRISHRFLQFSAHIRNRDPRYPLIQKKVETLADRTGELAQFIVEEHNQVVYVFQSAGEQGVKIDTKAGKFENLHTTAAGKAILSTWSEESVDAFISEVGLPQQTAHSITNEKRLFDELDQVRDRGYAINDQENIDGLRALSVPVAHPDDNAVGALSVSGPVNRMKGDKFENKIPDLLLGVSNELELNFRFLF